MPLRWFFFLVLAIVLASSGSAQALTQVSTAALIGSSGQAGGPTMQASVQAVASGVSGNATGGLVAGSAQTVVIQQPFAVSPVVAAAVPGAGGGGGGCRATHSSGSTGTFLLLVLTLGALLWPRLRTHFLRPSL